MEGKLLATTIFVACYKMNKIKQRMFEVLRELKNEYGVIAVKAEFEAEGSRLDELIMLNEVVFRADMDFIIKIGGCEAVRDLDQCKILGANGIMAPMIETPFAMQKFVNAARKVYKDQVSNIEWIINTETKTCRQNFDEILEVGKGFLNTIAIGRVDLSTSMGVGRENINGEQVFEASEEFARKAKNAGLKVGIGGGVSMAAIPFFIRLKPYLYKFETRKIVFKFVDDENLLKRGLVLAMEFELLYLKNKCEFYSVMAQEDKERIVMLEKRYAYAKEQLGIR